MLRKTFKLLSPLLFTLFSLSCAPKVVPLKTSDPCLIYWGALDVGSGSTKVKVAELDICRKEVKSVVFDASEKVDYEEARTKSSNGSFGPAIVNRGVSAIKRLQEGARKWDVAGYSGVATGAFRKAADGQTAIEILRVKAGADLSIISQEEEALLGFEAAVAAAKISRSSALVWDIGGSTMQMTASRKPGQASFYKGDMASVSFKKMVIERILKKDPSETKSPNPLSKSEMNRAVSLARKSARSVDSQMKNRLSHPNTQVLGIGGVHFDSVAGQLGKKSEYTEQELWKFLPTLVGKSDAEIGGEYADTQFTNLILVLGFMQELGIKKVTPLKVNLADGVLARRALREMR